MTKRLLLSTCFALSTVCAQHVSAAQDKPNIVLMVMDNLGWGEIGVYGGGILRGAATPRLDRLAAEGMRFLNFNVETQCTPSRSALMTGRHPIRSGTTRVVWGQLYGMTQWEVTIAELLSDQGYATAMFGKWHLGDSAGRFPTDQGFDEWYGIPNTTDESVYTAGFQFDPESVEPPHIMRSLKGETPKNVKVYDRDSRRAIDAELAEVNKPHFEPEFLRKYIAHAKRIYPIMTEDAINVLRDYYLSIRKQGEIEGSAVPITPRQLEAFVRLAEASARARLSDVVSTDDADRAVKIVEYWLKKVTGEGGDRFDIDIIATGTSRSQREQIIILRDVITELTRDESSASLQDIVELAEEKGIAPTRVESWLNRWKEEGEVYSPRKNRYKLVEKR